jgi:hypothetical protein
MISVGDVTPEMARALGISVRIENDGDAGMKVWLEYKAQGELEKVTYVRMQLGEGKNRIASAQLRVSAMSAGVEAAHFSAFPKYLPESSFMIVVYNGPKGDVGYNVRVKDFVKLPAP